MRRKKREAYLGGQAYYSDDSTQKDPSKRCSLDTGVDGTARRGEEFWVMSVASGQCALLPFWPEVSGCLCADPTQVDVNNP